MIDRIAPTRRPYQTVVMQQEWRHLAFLHWAVDAGKLQKMLPSGLTVDTFEGRAYIGLVPFTMRNVRPAGFPAVRGLSHFHETNVRTYVQYQGQNPGVWFFSLDAANEIAVQIARLTFKLPYFFARMSLTRSGDTLRYTSERLHPAPLPAQSDVQIVPTGNVFFAIPGTLEHFLAERYILYSGSNNKLNRGRVHHAPYPLQTATVMHLDDSLVSSAGIVVPDTPPIAHYAAAVDVEVFPLVQVSKGRVSKPFPTYRTL